MGTTGSGLFSRLSRPLYAKLAIALICLFSLLAFDLLTGPTIRIGGLLVAVPALSATFLPPRYVFLVVVATVPSVVIAAVHNHQLNVANFPVQMTTVALISIAAVVSASVRQRRERELAQTRWVAETAQSLLLRPLPRQLGPVAISSVYIAAEEGATIGGDVYAAVSTERGVRVLLGDVQGKGLAAVEMVGYLLRAFRHAAKNGTALAELPDFLDRSLREDLTDAQDAEADGAPDSVDSAAVRRAMEGFVTAVIVEFLEGEAVVRIANRGHPPPLLIHQGGVMRLEPREPSLPLGLGDLCGGTQHVDTYDLAFGDTLLLYTDGVIEARNAAGRFYPLEDRLTQWVSSDSDEVLDALQDDLLRHVGTRLVDDAAMVTLRRTA
ncbi:PP2C family protein-serine/threonine phosphatase [Streptomyces sp. NPDC058001]|uniref:PP2C family protein-serine/threonine phosphatase n=1 Tax=Streptomyces sp. NPDC058001 TaxID=3346300 RepID=UPI0036E4C2F1